MESSRYPAHDLAAKRGPSRRAFVRNGLGAVAAGLLARSRGEARGAEQGAGGRDEAREGRLGIYLNLDADPDTVLARARDLGFPFCEVFNDDISDATADRLRTAAERTRVRILTLFSAGPGETAWDFYRGPPTVGLVPREWRARRVEHLKRASDFAKRCGIPMLETHCGFIPEDPNDELYEETVKAVREVAGRCRENGQTFLYHAGQETPITLLRTIRDVGLDNQGVGLDTANLILYAKGDPVDALEVIGPHLRAVNAKDGLLPTDPRNLGREVPIGEGRVDFPALFARLKALGYRGPVLIEREISGPQLIEDVRKAKVYLEKLMS